MGIRAKIREHLENPPRYCLCHAVAVIDGARKRLISLFGKGGE